MEDLKPLESKLDLALQILGEIKEAQSATPVPVPAAPRPAYETPPLDVSQVVADGKTINRDGSVWAVDDGRWSGQKGAPVKVRYGYISEAKDPGLWAGIKATLGAEAFARWDARRDPWALYVADPGAYLATGAANMITLSYLLNSHGRLVQ